MRRIELAARYALFAAAATLTNVAVQVLSLRLYDGDHALYLAMALGTGAGLLLKYVLDKRFIFHFRPASVREDLATFILYGVMSVLTTALFWGTELAFDALFPSEHAKFVGAVLGLSSGYTLKYFLSKWFVFGRRRGAGAGC